jgi:hypothetical protein
MLRQALVPAAILGLCSAFAAAQAQEPSLGDIARQHAAKKAKVVVSNEDLPARPVPPAASEPAPDAGTAAAQPQPKPASPAAAAPAAATPSVPAVPLTAAQADAQQELQDAQSHVDYLNRQIKDTQTKLAAATEDARREVLNNILANYQAEMPQAQVQLENAQADVQRADKAAAVQQR